MWKADVAVTYKEGIAEPQGATVQESLNSLGFKGLESIRIGKHIEINLDDSALSEDDARNQVKQMCEKLLANPVMESYRIKLEKIQS
jgi:phosphoribosylformylglycinamidine synthase